MSILEHLMAPRQSGTLEDQDSDAPEVSGQEVAVENP